MPDGRAVAVVLSGLPGVGKSTLARALAARTGALWLRVDAIEQEMRISHMACDDLADGGYAALRAVGQAALAQGYDVIADAVNPIAITRLPLEAMAARSGAGLVSVELVCSDRAQHRHRVETRAADVPGLVLPDWASVEARDYAPYDSAVLRLDSAALAAEALADRVAKAMEAARWQS